MLTKDDYALPEDITLTCDKGHDITNEVCAGECNRTFREIYAESDMPQVACGVYNKNNGHICYDCWDHLPEVEDGDL